VLVPNHAHTGSGITWAQQEDECMGISLQLPEGSPWRTVIRVCLLLLSEGAVIAMLRDAPLLFLVATAIVPVSVVAVLELDDRFKPNKRWLVTASIISLAVIYGGFVTYAVRKSIQSSALTRARDSHRAEVSTRLKAFYDESNMLFRESMGVKTSNEYTIYDAKAEDFSRRLEKWVTENMGSAANARLLRYTMAPNLTFKNAINQGHSSAIVAMMQTKENIGSLIENPVWDNN
jgi:hypothetical protein